MVWYQSTVLGSHAVVEAPEPEEVVVSKPTQQEEDPDLTQTSSSSSSSDHSSSSEGEEPTIIQEVEPWNPQEAIENTTPLTTQPSSCRSSGSTLVEDEFIAPDIETIEYDVETGGAVVSDNEAEEPQPPPEEQESFLEEFSSETPRVRIWSPRGRNGGSPERRSGLRRSFFSRSPSHRQQR
eukprot:scaffold526_cov159-Amphora_coffeaeformis.AAC.1